MDRRYRSDLATSLCWGQHLGISAYLIRQVVIAPYRYHSITTIFERVTTPSVLLFAGRFGVIRAIDEYADAGNATTLIIEIGLDENIRGRRVLGEIGKAELSLVQLVEKRALE